MEITYSKETGLLLVNEVPFTEESLEMLVKVIKLGNAKNNKQFTYGVTIADVLNESSVFINEHILDVIYDYMRENNIDLLASDEDFCEF